MRLEYARPSDAACPDERRVGDLLAENFGYDPIDRSAAARLVVAVTRHAHELRVEMTYYDADGGVQWGDRIQAPARCMTLVSAMATEARAGIDIVAVPPSPVPPRVVIVERPASVALPKTSAVALAPPPPAPPSERPKIRIGLGTALEAGSAPGVTGGLSAQAGVRWPFVSVSTEASLVLPVSSSALAIKTSALTGSVLPCFHYGIALGCGVLAVGTRWVATADGLSSSALLVEGGARLGIEIPVDDRFAFRLAGDVLGQNHTLVRFGRAPRWSTSAPTGALGLGGVVSF